MVVIRSTISGSIALNAEFNATVIGKNVEIATRTIFGKRPYPNQSTRSGAMVTTGIVCEMVISGESNLSSVLKKSIKTASKKPISTPIARPTKDSRSVIHVCVIRS